MNKLYIQKGLSHLKSNDLTIWKCCIMGLVALNLVACAGIPVIGNSQKTVQVYISDGSRQCRPKSTQLLVETKNILHEKDIAVLKSECGFLERIYPTVCGAGTGGIHIHSIYVKDLELAKKSGFMELQASIPHHKANCKIN